MRRNDDSLAARVLAAARFVSIRMQQAMPPMSVYVDAPRHYPASMIKSAQTRRNGTHWSHLWADSEDELIQFAHRIGMAQAWIQHRGTRHVHFDVTPPKRQRAITLGAVQMERREWLKQKI